METMNDPALHDRSCGTVLSLGLSIVAPATPVDPNCLPCSSMAPGDAAVAAPSLSLSLSSGEARRVVSRRAREEKKLRLTREQSAVLEDRFRENTSLTPKQKQALAEQLSLRPRQVEVWFQNRRARTKLKQTEEDRRFLEKYFGVLTDENRRLQKELQELKAREFSSNSPLFVENIPAAAPAMCPSCERGWL